MTEIPIAAPFPTGLGAVVNARLKKRPLDPAARVIHAGKGWWISENVSGTYRQDSLLLESIVSHGWDAPTPEPMGFGAQVESATGVVLTRALSGDSYPWVDAMGATCTWASIRQPVTVLYEGRPGCDFQ